MSFQAIEGKGVNRVNCLCDDCGRQEVVTCDYIRHAGNRWVPNEGRAKKKLAAQGWAEVNGKMLCPACVRQRKVTQMNTTQKAPPVADDLRKPTREQKREIMLLLGDVYDCDTGCYLGGETDQTVADALSVMPGWVSELREEFFGPDGANADMATLGADLAEFVERTKAHVTDLTAVLEEAKALKLRLEKIKTAVGKRVMAKVGK